MKQQKGVALLTILLLVVAITVVAGSMLASQKVMVREYDVAQTQAQFNQYVLYGEATAKQLIWEDSQSNQTDSFQDIWTKPLDELTVNNAKISLKIVDESERFNINNLYHDGKMDMQAMAYFRALLTANGIDANVANAVLDWQDPDSDSAGDGGAEFDFYQSLGKKNSVQIANQSFYSVDELLNVRGINKEKLAKIKPFLTAVPFFLPMNINVIKPELLNVIGFIQPTDSQAKISASAPASTATPQNEMAISQLDLMAINEWASKRKVAVPIESVDIFWQLPIMNKVSSPQKTTMTPLLSVQSYTMKVITAVKVDDKERFFSSYLAKQQKSSDTLNTQNHHNDNIVIFNRQILPFLPD